MFQSLVQLGVVCWYELNKDYVSTVLCVNKDKPQMHCNGKCYLKKQLKKTEDRSSKSTGSKSEKYALVYFIVQEFSFELRQPIRFAQNYISHYNDFTPHNPIVSIFRPPQSILVV